MASSNGRNKVTSRSEIPSSLLSTRAAQVHSSSASGAPTFQRSALPRSSSRLPRTKETRPVDSSSLRGDENEPRRREVETRVECDGLSVADARPAPKISAPVGNYTRSRPSPQIPHSLGLPQDVSSPGLDAPKRMEHRNKHVLRRKPSTISQTSGEPRGNLRSGSTTSPYDSNPSLATTESMSMPEGYRDPFPGSLLGMTLPPAVASSPVIGSATSTSKSDILSKSHRDGISYALPHKISTHDLPPPSSVYSHSAGSSSRYTDSPGAFSRTSTPTSLSSHSPGTFGLTKVTSRTRVASPTRTRPPLSRRRAGGNGPAAESPPIAFDTQGLPSVRESLTSSSSSSTVKAGERGDNKERETKKKKKRLSPPPPSPPPRTSSRKLTTKHLAKHSEDGPKIQQPPTIDYKEAETLQYRRQPPTRPSRDGAPDLGEASDVPVIHSNLASLGTTKHRRGNSRGSISGLKIHEDLAYSSSSLQSSPQFHPMGPQKHTNRFPSPSPSQSSVPFSDYSISTRLGSTPELQQSDNSVSPKTSHATELSPSKSISRFGIFSRKMRSETSNKTLDKPQKLKKKGPIAGTGHEGYTRYAGRGRSGSTTSTTGSQTRSISAESSSSSRGLPDIDEYFVGRLNPVVIGGGGNVIENQNSPSEYTRSGSSQGSVGSRPSLDSKASSQIARSKLSHELRRPLGVETNPDIAFSKRGVSKSHPSHSTDNETESKPRLAIRRSTYRSEIPMDKSTLRIPSPMEIQGSISSMEMKGGNLAPTSRIVGAFSEGQEGNWLRPLDAEKRLRSPRKWNFLQRSQPSPQPNPNLDAPSPEVKVSVSQGPAPRPIAHYAMLDSAEELGPGIDELERIMHDVESHNYEGHRGELIDESERSQAMSVLLPSPPSFPIEFSRDPRMESPKVIFQRPDMEPQSRLTAEDSRPSRLQQIGRIPRVVSKRDRERNLPKDSFSRPFVSTAAEIPSVTHNTHTIASLHSDSPSFGQDTFVPHYLQNDPQNLLGEREATAINDSNPKGKESDEFFSFPPRKMSQISGSSSSGVVSLSNITSNVTANVPIIGTGLGEDEVWNEYDDLIDDVLTRTVIPGTTLSFIQPLPSSLEHASRESMGLDQERQSGAGRGSSPVTGQESEPTHETTLSVHHLSDGLPTTPASFTSFLAGYGERNTSMIESVSARDSRESQRSLAVQTILRDDHTEQNDPSGEESTLSRNTTDASDKKQVEFDSQLNLRFGALMTSRWLSFGRVLFSPAHTEVREGKQDRILILDGLGNDDWSFYTALTYPEVTVYNLSPSQSCDGSTQSGQESPFRPPPNHRQICHPSVSDPFPFPRGFFTAVILRFLVVSSDDVYRHIVSESKRVLRPGGYLETSIIDIDLLNIGSRTRRALRSLKVRLQGADSSFSLKPVSDNIQRMIHRKGFEGLNRCMVGVPAAGKLASSTSGSTSSLDKDLSLGDMLRDPSREGDEVITKTIAKIGRWWYTRCYEMPVLQDGNLFRSIWNDKSLLRECENKKTTFRLLICYAQKPSQNRRRTVSL